MSAIIGRLWFWGKKKENLKVILLIVAPKKHKLGLEFLLLLCQDKSTKEENLSHQKKFVMPKNKLLLMFWNHEFLIIFSLPKRMKK